MVAAYLTAIATNHPFIDGNKRTAAHTAIAFLYLNGYQIKEFHETELADLVLAYLQKEKMKDDIADFLADRAVIIE